MECFHEIRSYKDNFSVWHSRYKNMSFLPHWHNEAELIYVTDGFAEITADGVLYKMETGDLLLCSSRCVHFSDTVTAKNELEFILFDPYTVISGHLASGENHYFSKSDLKRFGLDSSVKELFRTVEAELKERRPYYKKIVSSAISGFWYAVKREFSDSDTAMIIPSFKRLEKAIEYIHLNFKEPITLESAADIAGLNTAYFSHIFKAHTGLSFVKYLQIIRIDEAIRRIAGGKDKIIDIALDVGFSNVRSFNRVFKELTGTTPREQLGKRGEISLNLNFPYISSGEKLVENDSFVVRLQRD